MTNQERIVESLLDVEATLEDAVLTITGTAVSPDSSIARTSTSYIAGYIGAALACVRKAQNALTFVKDKPDGLVEAPKNVQAPVRD